MMAILDAGYRVIAHHRREHGRSTQTASGNDVDIYLSDVVGLTDALDRTAVDISPAAGGGEVARYMAPCWAGF